MTPFKRFCLMFTLTMMWSPSFLFIKLAIQEIPPISIVTLRVSLAAFIFIVILILKKTPLPKSHLLWLRMGIMALFSSILPFCLFCYAEQTIDSALAAILNGTTPMFTAILAHIFVKTDKMNPQKIIGVFLSCLGLILLFIPKLQEGVTATGIGMSAALTAAFFYAVAHVYGKLYLTGLKPFVAPTMQLILSTIFLLPFAFFKDKIWSFPFPSLPAACGVGGLAFFGTVCAFIIYYQLLKECGPTAISTVACFFPAVGMFFGFIFLEETFNFPSLFAAGMILCGMLYVNEVVSFDFFKRVFFFKTVLKIDNQEEIDGPLTY